MICFLDESATDAKDMDQAVLGGIVMNRRDVPELNAAWATMLDRYGLPAGLHMYELGPKGPYPHLVGDACSEMLAAAVSVINSLRIFTFAASWDNRKHEVLFSDAMRQDHFSVYAMAFMMAVEINRASAVSQRYISTVDYILDDGNRFKQQIIRMHNSITTLPSLRQFQVGALHFNTDTNIPALQAADVVAWTERRRKSGKLLGGIHAPLSHLFDDMYADSVAPEHLIKQLADSFALAEAGLIDTTVEDDEI